MGATITTSFVPHAPHAQRGIKAIYMSTQIDLSCKGVGQYSTGSTMEVGFLDCQLFKRGTGGTHRMLLWSPSQRATFPP